VRQTDGCRFEVTEVDRGNDSIIGSTVEERFRYTHHWRVRDVLM